MTRAADRMRDQRRADAAPGGPHDRLIHFLYKALPMSVGAIAAVMIISPLFPRSEVSFLLDRNKVAITSERLRVDGATYRGEDDKGRPFSLSATSAVQHSAQVAVVELQGLMARLQMASGPAEVAAPVGRYDIARERMEVAGPVTFRTADGYRLTTSNVAVELKTHRASGSGGVSGEVPSGRFSAERIAIDLSERDVTLEGRAHLHMTPGKAAR